MNIGHQPPTGVRVIGGNRQDFTATLTLFHTILAAVFAACGGFGSNTFAASF